MGDIVDMLALEDSEIEDMVYNPHTATYKTCKHCGKDFLTWVMTDRGWRLQESSGVIHTCKNHKNHKNPQKVKEEFHLGDVFNIDGRLAILAQVTGRDHVNIIFLDNGRCGQEAGYCYEINSRTTFSIHDILNFINEDYTYDDITYLGPCKKIIKVN